MQLFSVRPFINIKCLQINAIVFQISNVKGMTENPSRRLWYISILADYRIYCQLCWLNVTLKMYTFVCKVNVILSSWPVVPNNQKINTWHNMDIDPKRRVNLHNLSYSQNYISVYSHSTTLWINHVSPQHDERILFMSNAT